MLTFHAELEKNELGFDLLKVEISKKGFRIATVWFSEEGTVRIEPEYNEPFNLEELFKIIQKIEPVATDFLFELTQKLRFRLPEQFNEALSEPSKPVQEHRKISDDEIQF